MPDRYGERRCHCINGDLEYNIALNLAKGGMVKAISAQMPYEQGEAVATVAVKALLDEVVPSYIGVEPVYVDRYNLQKSGRNRIKSLCLKRLNRL